MEKIFQERLKKGRKGGFTLIELLVVIGIIGILAAVVLVAVNPAHQFALARDTQRLSNINAILNGVGQNIAEHKGQLVCNGVVTSVPVSQPYIIGSGATSSGQFNLYPCLVPTYLSAMPLDPSRTAAHYATSTDYDTQYIIQQDTNGRITISANGEIDPYHAITVTR